ncbi:MAG: glycosyltransferase family 4 protein [Actinobacteria bacterium]|nr:glycosyltransferase family 4 protein [Actinomycetota bacterium]
MGGRGPTATPSRRLVIPRILHLTHSAALGGGELALLRLSRGLPEGFDPVLACGEEGPLLDRAAAQGLATHVLPLAEAVRARRRDRMGGVAGLRAAPAVTAYALRLARFMRDHGVNVVHTNSLKAHVYGIAAARLAGVPVVSHLRDDLSHGRRRLVPAFVRGLLRGTDATVGCSAYVLRAAGLSATPHRVVYSGVPASQVTGRIRPPEDPPVVGMVARIAPWKGQHVLLDAAARIAARRPDTRFRVVGGPLFGEERYLDELHRRAARPPLAGWVEFTGFVRDALAAYDKLAVAVAHALQPEPFGPVVIEAMARGVPVVAADRGDPAEVVTPGVDGHLAPPGRTGALARAVDDLLADPLVAPGVGKAAADTVRQRFTLEQNAARFAAVVRQVVR